MTAPQMGWISFAVSILMVLLYELIAYKRSHRHPDHQARFANARVRMAWVDAISTQPGFEVVGVQALRNALMSATVTASTSALALMGSLTLAGAGLVSGLGHLQEGGALALRTTLEGVLVVLLFSSYVCSAMAMRYYSHTGFIVSMPVNSAERQAHNPVAMEYVRRAGLLYGWGIRLFMAIVPPIAGVLNPMALVPATLVLLVAYWLFDRPAMADVD